MPIVQNGADSGKQNAPISFQSKDPRGLRFETRRYLVKRYYESGIWEPNLVGCGQPLMRANGVLVRKDGERAGYTGVKTCARASACPVCAAKIGVHRAGEIQKVCEHYSGGTVVLLTLTMRHNRGQKLVDLWRALSKGWKAATNGRQWRRERENFGITGYVRSIEGTWGASNGWHMHVHSLLFFDDPDLTQERIETLAESMFYRWSSKLVEVGLDAPTLKHGVDWKRVGSPDSSTVLASYLTKIASGVGFEVGGSTEKKGRLEGHYSPWQLAQLAVSCEDNDEREKYWQLWNEWREVSRGKRFIAWSRGLREDAGLGEELTDEEIAAEGDGGNFVATIPSKSWRIIRNHYPRVLGEILRLVEAGHDWKNLDDVLSVTDSRLMVFPPPAEIAGAGRNSTTDPPAA